MEHRENMQSRREVVPQPGNEPSEATVLTTEPLCHPHKYKIELCVLLFYIHIVLGIWPQQA